MQNKFLKFEQVKEDIIDALNSLNKKIFTVSDIDKLLSTNKTNWNLPKRTGKKEFIQFLKNEDYIDEFIFEFPKTRFIKYSLKNASHFELALSLNKQSYLCQQSAAFLHGLIDHEPKSIYINLEQTPKGNQLSASHELEQTNIDRAFANKMRVTNQVAKIGDYTLYSLSGKMVNRIGVENHYVSNSTLPVTCLERTLIDMTVRPVYAGGCSQVLMSYIAAKNNLCFDKFLDILEHMDFTYPYHQAIGFYMEKSNYSSTYLDKLNPVDLNISFIYHMEIKIRSFRIHGMFIIQNASSNSNIN
jgi:predicted transcriptional regulator of viral defense system